MNSFNKDYNNDIFDDCTEVDTSYDDESSLDDLEEYGFEEEPVKGEFADNSFESDIIENESALESDEMEEILVPESEEMEEVPEAPEIVTASNVDIFRDEEVLKDILIDFKQDNWDDLSNGERKECIANLKEYIENTIGLDNCPKLEFYNNEDAGDYAYVTGDGQTIAINEYNLWDSKEAADSIAHELWHAYQRQRASMLENEIDQTYADGFENYIGPEIDFQMYQDQFVESDAREFAQRIKDYTDSI